MSTRLFAAYEDACRELFYAVVAARNAGGELPDLVIEALDRAEAARSAWREDVR
jgi:hypothetical protein